MTSIAFSVVQEWYAKKRAKQIWDHSDASEWSWSWRRLSKGMHVHSCKLHEFTLQISSGMTYALPNEYNEDMISFKD